MAKKRQWQYVVSLGGHPRTQSRDNVGLIDMLRYDSGAIVDDLGAGRFRIVGNVAPTIARWDSFGIQVSEVIRL